MCELPPNRVLRVDTVGVGPATFASFCLEMAMQDIPMSVVAVETKVMVKQTLRRCEYERQPRPERQSSGASLENTAGTPVTRVTMTCYSGRPSLPCMNLGLSSPPRRALLSSPFSSLTTTALCQPDTVVRAEQTAASLTLDQSKGPLGFSLLS